MKRRFKVRENQLNSLDKEILLPLHDGAHNAAARGFHRPLARIGGGHTGNTHLMASWPTPVPNTMLPFQSFCSPMVCANKMKIEILFLKKMRTEMPANCHLYLQYVPTDKKPTDRTDTLERRGISCVVSIISLSYVEPSGCFGLDTLTLFWHFYKQSSDPSGDQATTVLAIPSI